MAHVKQGIYKKYLNNYRKCKEEFEELLEDNYDENDLFQGDYVIAWNVLSNADRIYQDSCKLQTKISDLLESQTLEQKEKKYRNIITELETINDTLCEKADELVDMLGPDFTNNENYELSQMKIISRYKH